MNPSPLARLLGVQRTTEARERLQELRQRYALTENDPVWELVAILEEFCIELKAETSPTPAPMLHARPMSSQDRWRLVVLGSAAAGLQTLLLGTSVVLGSRLAHTPNWLATTLSMPIGLVAYLLCLPFMGALIYLGWRARHTETVLAWCLAIVGGGAAAGILFALWMIL